MLRILSMICPTIVSDSSTPIMQKQFNVILISQGNKVTKDHHSRSDVISQCVWNLHSTLQHGASPPIGPILEANIRLQIKIVSDYNENVNPCQNTLAQCVNAYVTHKRKNLFTSPQIYQKLVGFEHDKFCTPNNNNKIVLKMRTKRSRSPRHSA